MNSIFLLSPWSREKYRTPLSSLLYLKYYLQDHGLEARILDCSQYGQDLDEVMDILKGDCPRIIGITSCTRDRFYAYDLIRRVRLELPDSVIVVGGRHFGFLAEETLKELPQVDIVVRGEGEVILKEICDAVKQRVGYGSIFGISYRNGDEIRHNADRSVEKDLDQFRNYDEDMLQSLRRDQLLFPTKCDEQNLYFSVMASRGCPGSCVFCCQGPTKVRFRSVESVVKEIEDKVRITGVRNVSFADSSFTVRKDFVTEFCDTVLSKKLNIRWNCYSRANVDLDLFKLMKRAGLVSIEVGLETASPKVLKAVRKRISLDQVENLCRTVHSLGIKVYVFCMVSLPDETLEDVDMTIDYVKRMSPYIYDIGLQVTRIMPDAAIFRIAKDRGILDEEFSWFRPYSVSDEVKELVKTELYYTEPLYLENLTVDEIKQKLREFRKVSEIHFTYFDTLRRNIRYNISRERLAALTMKSFLAKVRTTSQMLVSAYKNYRKAKYFET